MYIRRKIPFPLLPSLVLWKWKASPIPTIFFTIGWTWRSWLFPFSSEARHLFTSFDSSRFESTEVEKNRIKVWKKKISKINKVHALLKEILIGYISWSISINKGVYYVWFFLAKYNRKKNFEKCDATSDSWKEKGKF